jgi:LPXTG-motif cell wall-anchored protein
MSSFALAAEPGNGIVDGRVVNETASGSSVADLDVILKTYLNDAEIDSTTTKTDIEGYFVFGGLSTELGYGYEVLVSFQQAEYYSEWLTFDEGETSKFTGVIVYDATTSSEAIKITMSHMIIYVEEDSLLVKEYYLLANEADRTYIGASGEADTVVLRFSLPAGATELQPTIGLMECCIVQNEEGFYDTMPLLPGSREVAYSYRINHNSGTYSFSQVIYYPTNRFDSLVQGEEVKITSDQLATDELMDINGIQFSHLSGQGLAAGETLMIRLSGLPRTNTQGSILWVLLALILIVAGFVFVYLMKRKRPQPVSDEGVLSQQQRLLAELAELDNEFEDGRIPEEAYRRVRAEKKAQLIALMQRQKEE